jgi:CelD/BcsL family acetyltransferase involved in cellulose biosynthesis
LRLHRVERADPNALDRFFELESSGWKGRERTAIACKPKNRLFFDEIAQASQQFGYLSLYFLELDGHTISAQFAFTYRSRCFVAKTAYDESYSQYSPTHLLVNAILGDCMERGVSEYDFLGPDEEWKRKWTSQVRPHAFLYIFRKGILGAVLHTVKFSIVPSVKRLLRRNGKWLRRDRSVHSAAENLGSQ